MSDRYSQLVNTPPGKLLAQQVGLPRPQKLDRHRPGDPVIRGRVLVGGAPGGRLEKEIAAALKAAGAETSAAVSEIPEQQRFKGLVFDATGIKDSTELVELQAFFHPSVRRLANSGRVVVLGTPPESCKDTREATAQRALEGFTRSLAKEVGRGSTVQLVYVAAKSEDRIDSTLRFLLSPKSTYVSGQVVRIGTVVPSPRSKAATIPELPADFNWEKPLAGKVALVTGASRGIGYATALKLARSGAHVVRLPSERPARRRPLQHRARSRSCARRPARSRRHLAQRRRDMAASRARIVLKPFKLGLLVVALPPLGSEVSPWRAAGSVHGTRQGVHLAARPDLTEAPRRRL